MREVELPVTCLTIWNEKLFTGVGNQILIRDLNSLKLLGSSSDFKNTISGITACEEKLLIWSKNTFIAATIDSSYQFKILYARKLTYTILHIRKFINDTYDFSVKFD